MLQSAFHLGADSCCCVESPESCSWAQADWSRGLDMRPSAALLMRLFPHAAMQGSSGGDPAHVQHNCLHKVWPNLGTFRLTVRLS